MINKLFLSSAAVVTLLYSTALALNSNSVSAFTQTSQTTLSKGAGKKLAPGRYCYSAKTKTLDATAVINISSAKKVNGTVQATIQNPAQGYYTSYNQKLTGELTGDKAKLQVITKIENDTQNTRETWTITASKLNTGRENFTKVNCKTVSSGEETTSTRNPIRIKFTPGTSSKTIEQSVIRGERDTYLVGAKKGQRINLRITSLEKNAVFDVIAPGGKTIRQDATTWNGTLPASGDYQIVVGGTRGNATYKLAVEIK
jgi:hypothetical protein